MTYAATWDEATITLLRDMWTQGFSTSEIGRRLGVSKNTIIGKAHRLDLPGRPSPIRRGPNALPAIASVPRVQFTLPPLNSLSVPVPNVVAAFRPVAAPVTRPNVSALPTPRPGPVLRMSTMTCQWLDGDTSRTFVQCTEHAVLGTSWCETHKCRVFVHVRKAA